MAFDPDAYIAKKQAQNFDPDAYLASRGVTVDTAMPELSQTTRAPYDGNLINTFREALQGTTFGFSDEIGAGMAAGMAAVIDGADFGTAYDDILKNVRQEQEAFREAEPILSTAAQIAGGIASGGAGLAKAGAKLAPVGASAAKRIATNVGVGSLEGAVAGAGFADEDKVEGAKTGAIVGGFAGGLGGEVIQKFAKNSALKKEAAELLAKGDTSNIKVARYMQAGANKVKKDRVAAEAIKQGYDEGTISVIKGASKADKGKMKRMMNLLEKGKQNTRFAALNRPSDVVGESLKQRIKFVEKANRLAGAKVKATSQALKGKQVDFEPAVNEFLNDIQEIGIRFDPLRGQVSFSGSDFEKIPGAERAITNILDRMRNTRLPDAYDVHRLKKFIDNHVEFGKMSDGSVGQAERVLKKLRANMDKALDGKFKAYDEANTTFSQTKGALDDIQKAAGSTIEFDSPNLDKSLGTLSRRFLSNVQSRGRLLDSLSELENVAAANGAKFHDDVITQALFADELGDMFGAAARTSLQGDLEKGIKHGFRAAASKDGVTGAVVDLAATKLDQARGINEDNAIKVMKQLLNR